MSQAPDFLNALYGSYEGAITFDLNEEIITIDDPQFIKENALSLRAFAETPIGVFFVYRVTEDLNNTVVFAKAPTLSLIHDRTRIDCWAFNSPVERTDPRFEELLATYEIAVAVPLPDVDGWDMTKCDLELSYDLADLLPAKAKEVAKFYDAKIINKFSPDKYADKSIIVTLGNNSKSMSWKPVTMPLIDLLKMLTQHTVGEKDGYSVVFADMAPGQRLKNAVKTVTAITLDIDTGTPTEEIDAALAKLNCLAVRYTTHSSDKIKSFFKKDHVTRSFPDMEIDTDLMKRYCAEIKNLHESIVESIEYGGIEHNSDGIQVVVTHQKMPKNRVVVPTSTPYEIANEANTQIEAMAKWAKYPEALAALLEVPFDRACTDPSRVFYLPRHDAKRGFSASIFGGKLFDRASLQFDDKHDALIKAISQKGGKSKTEEGKALGKWSMKTAHGFQIADVLEDHREDKLRGKASLGYNIECPFDEGHSNAGDTSDRACFAVNAADGGNELFIISCRHGTCQDYTNIDMLGKMIKDNWFPKEIIEDRKYNILALEEEAKEKIKKKEAKEKPEAVLPADLPAFEAEIENMTEHTLEEDSLKVAVALLKSKPSGVRLGTLTEKIKRKLKTNTAGMKKLLRTAGDIIKEEAGNEPDNRDPQGRKIFRYENNGFNFHEATSLCVQILLEENRRKITPTSELTEPYPIWAQISGTPVKLVKEEKTERYVWKEYSILQLWAALSAKIVFCRKNDGDNAPMTQVDEHVAKYVFSEFYDKFPEAAEIVYTPIYTPDGKLISKPGYYGGEDYPGMNLILAENALDVGEVIMDPKAEDAEAALEWLRDELLNDFPFLDSDEEGKERREPSEANALAMLITPYMRRMIDSCTPLYFITKPVPGTGGTLLGRISMLLFDGVSAAPARYSQSEEEMNKSLIAELMQGHSHMFYDDVKDFNSRELLRALTSKRIGGRILGSNRTISRDNNFSWIATGNNPGIGSEMDRRIVWIRLNAKMANIQDRKFKYKNLEGFILGTTSPEVVEGVRGMAVRAILTLIQYWINTAQMAPFLVRERKSFEDWSAKVGGVLQAIGVEGFLDNRKDLGQDADEAGIKTFVKAWVTRFGTDRRMTPTEIYNWALSDVNLDIIEGATEDQKKSRFLKKLPTIEGRTFSIEGFDHMVMSGHNHEDNLSYYIAKIGKSVVAVVA